MTTQVKQNIEAQEISTDSLLSNNPVINSNSRLENIESLKSVMLIYPPSKLYQRGEDRSQGNVEDSTATTVRAANDLGYAASMLKKSNYRVFLRDYQTEKLTLAELHHDVDDFQPDVIFMSITNSTIFNDIKVIDLIKEKYSDIIVILKGSIFFDPSQELLNQLNLQNIEYLIGGESDFIVPNLLNSHFNNKKDLDKINGIVFKKEGEFIKTIFNEWDQNLDILEFPDRSLMNNSLYLRPDTGETQATIATSRGCPAACIYCLTPTISGKKIRFRSPENIHKELLDCYKNYNIRNFFFKSDTFTMDSKWVSELCTLIVESELNNKIEWVANSRVNPIKKETLQVMKNAGCWLVAFGFESGSPDSLKKMKKGATVKANLAAARYAKEVGLKVFGFYLIGLPWEDESHIRDTVDMMYKIDADFIEMHIATPYYGTELHEIAKAEGLIDDTVLGRDYFTSPSVGTKFLSIEKIKKIQKRTILLYHLRPLYIIKKLVEAIFKPKIFLNYFKFGMRLIKKNIA
jgi:anaerobic magnesium-protoporphyrin IX monomethyl ester cyclase